MSMASILALLSTKADWTARDQLILDMVRAGQTPSWLKTSSWPTVTVNEGGHTLQFWASPDDLQVGDDIEPVSVPMTPYGAQAAANHFNSILPSRKLARLIYQNAAQKVGLSDVKAPPKGSGIAAVPIADIEKVYAVGIANQIDRLKYKNAAGVLVAGQRKNVVVGPQLDGSHVAIFGGKFNDGPDGPAGKVIAADKWAQQAYSTIHGSYYADYSHGIRFVFRKALLDGRWIDLVDLFQDPKLAFLVLDDGQTYVPVFPNKGPKAVKPTLLGSGAGSGADQPTGVVSGPIIPPGQPGGLTPALAKSGSGGVDLTAAFVLAGVAALVYGLGSAAPR